MRDDLTDEERELLNRADAESLIGRWRLAAELVKVNAQSIWWATEHALLTRLFGLRFCHSCSGYFRDPCMVLPDTCEACYARNYGIPVTPGMVITSPFTSDNE